MTTPEAVSQMTVMSLISQVMLFKWVDLLLSLCLSQNRSLGALMQNAEIG